MLLLKWIFGFLICIYFLALEVSLLTVTPLKITESVVSTITKTVCVPKEFRFIRMRYAYGRDFRQLYDDLSKIQAAMGKYGSSHEPWIFKMMRVCAEAVKRATTNSVCPNSAVQMLTGSVAELRHRILGNTRILDATLGMIMSAWNMLPKVFTGDISTYTNTSPDITAPWPPSAASHDSRISVRTVASSKEVGNTIFPSIRSEITDAFNILRDVPINLNKDIALPQHTNASFETILALIDSQMVNALQSLRRLISTRDQLEKGQKNSYFRDDKVSSLSFPLSIGFLYQ